LCLRRSPSLPEKKKKRGKSRATPKGKSPSLKKRGSGRRLSSFTRKADVTYQQFISVRREEEDPSSEFVDGRVFAGGG